MAVSPDEFKLTSIYPSLRPSCNADIVRPELIWLLNDWLDVNFTFPFIKADILSVELTSIERGSDNLLKPSPNGTISKSDGPDISVIAISYPSSDSMINWSKFKVLIAFKPVWVEYWFITFANAEMSLASIVALIDIGSLFFAFNLKLMSPLVPLLKGPKSTLVFASTAIPVPDNSVDNFFTRYWAEAFIGTSVVFVALLTLVVLRS